MKGQKSYWVSDKKQWWVCPNHCPPVKIHSKIQSCYFSCCNNQRPIEKPLIKEKIAIKEQKHDLCAWKPCKEKKRPNSKYCSHNCKNKNARHRYNMKKKGIAV